jgi:hypothetical protein
VLVSCGFQPHASAQTIVVDPELGFEVRLLMVDAFSKDATSAKPADIVGTKMLPAAGTF